MGSQKNKSEAVQELKRDGSFKVSGLAAMKAVQPPPDAAYLLRNVILCLLVAEIRLCQFSCLYGISF